MKVRFSSISGIWCAKQVEEMQNRLLDVEMPNSISFVMILSMSAQKPVKTPELSITSTILSRQASLKVSRKINLDGAIFYAVLKSSILPALSFLLAMPAYRWLNRLMSFILMPIGGAVSCIFTATFSVWFPAEKSNKLPGCQKPYTALKTLPPSGKSPIL